MKLGELKSAIRDFKGAVKFRANLRIDGDHDPLDMDIVKGVLLERLDERYGSKRSAETGLYLTPEGFLSRESERVALGHAA